MDENKPRRKRIPLKKLSAIPAIGDALEFISNNCSRNARKEFSVVENFKIEGWFDKHYHVRQQHGDDAGKREGINPEAVQSLVTRSIKFLLQFSAMVKGFKFINHPDSSEQGLRIIVREECNGSLLNLVLQSYYLDPTNFEITVITAMLQDDFRVAPGQYVVELQEDGADLFKADNGKFSKLLSL